MDRVLLVIDDIAYATHLESTFRKIGFEVEHLLNEMTLSDRLLIFNPDYVIVKGASAKVSAMSVGRKLKEANKFLGKVILIFPADQQSTADDFIKLRMDLLLIEPISALRLVTHLLSLSDLDKASITDKLLRIAQSDMLFRTYESSLLKNAGSNIDLEMQFVIEESITQESEIQNVDDQAKDEFFEMLHKSEAVPSKQSQIDSVTTKKKFENLESDESLNTEGSPEDYEISEDFKNKLKSELLAVNQELPLRIETYNRLIKNFDQDLHVGLSKRQTKSASKILNQGINKETHEKIDTERRKFVKALMKK